MIKITSISSGIIGGFLALSDQSTKVDRLIASLKLSEIRDSETSYFASSDALQTGEPDIVPFTSLRHGRDN
jgi:hypothetical protein